MLATAPRIRYLTPLHGDDRIRLMDRSCAYAVRHVRLTCAAIDIVESSCTPRSRMLLDAMMLHPHTSIQRGGGCECGCSALRIIWHRSSLHSTASNVMPAML